MDIFTSELDTSILVDEYVHWIRTYGNGRNEDDLRFGQYLINKYGTGKSCPAVFYEESASVVFTAVTEMFI